LDFTLKLSYVLVFNSCGNTLRWRQSSPVRVSVFIVHVPPMLTSRHVPPLLVSLYHQLLKTNDFWYWSLPMITVCTVCRQPRAHCTGAVSSTLNSMLVRLPSNDVFNQTLTLPTLQVCSLV